MATTAYDIIKRPIITEQSMAETEAKKYTFEVAKSANKIEIAKAVEEIFGVKVAKVNTLNMQGKEKRTGRSRLAPSLLEEGHGHPDRGFQDHRVLRGHGVRRITNNGYQDL
mgnify:CR=1 FL=1